MKSNKHMKYFLIVFLIFLLPIVCPGDTEIEPPPGAIGPTEHLDEISRQQLDYFLEIAGHVETINRVSFFKPYDKPSTRKISRLLGKAAAIEPDECHKQYLDSLSYNVLGDTFYSLSPEWFNLEKNKAEIIFLPDETHLVQELWLKLNFLFSPLDWRKIDFKDFNPLASGSAEGTSQAGDSVPHKIFDTFVFLNDVEETQRFEEYIEAFDKMQDHVPLEKKDKPVPYTAYIPPIKIAHLVYSSKPGIVSIVYPEREVFYQSGRFKIVIFKNLIDAYVECILKPISEKVLADDPLMPAQVDSEAYFSNLVMYKIAHHIGPVFVLQPKGKEAFFRKAKDKKEKGERGKEEDFDEQRERARAREEALREREEQLGKKKEMELLLISESLGDTFPVSEELKASVVAIYNTSVLIEQGLIPKEQEINIYAAYLVSLVDKIRKAQKKSPNWAAAIQFNYLLKKEAIRFNINTKKITIQLYLFPTVIQELAQLVIERYKMPQSFFREYGQLSPELKAISDNLQEIPVDVNINVNIKAGLQPGSN